MNSFEISADPVDLGEFRRSLADNACGALVIFEGWVRDHNEGRAVLHLAYEVHEPMALKEGQIILREAMDRFDIAHVRAIHRQGHLTLSEPAVVVGVSSAHRDAAFRACRYVIDEIKHRLPIWKKEFYADGSAEWVNCRQCVESRSSRDHAPA